MLHPCRQLSLEWVLVCFCRASGLHCTCLPILLLCLENVPCENSAGDALLSLAQLLLVVLLRSLGSMAGKWCRGPFISLPHTATMFLSVLQTSWRMHQPQDCHFRWCDREGYRGILSGGDWWVKGAKRGYSPPGNSEDQSSWRRC